MRFKLERGVNDNAKVAHFAHSVTCIYLAQTLFYSKVIVRTTDDTHTHIFTRPVALLGPLGAYRGQ